MKFNNFRKKNRLYIFIPHPCREKDTKNQKFLTAKASNLVLLKTEIANVENSLFMLKHTILIHKKEKILKEK